MSTLAPPPDGHEAACSHPETEPRAKVPLRTRWPRLKKKVSEDLLRETTKERFGYHPHDWQVEAALKVLEGNDGIVLAGTGKGKTLVFALLGLAAELSGSNGYFVIISPLKALEGDQVCINIVCESWSVNQLCEHRSIA